MSTPVAAGSIAIEATDSTYFGLKHMPGGRPLDKDGKGVWPADQFTFRLIGEGALREQAASVDEPQPNEPAVDPSPQSQRKARPDFTRPAAVESGEA